MMIAMQRTTESPTTPLRELIDSHLRHNDNDHGSLDELVAKRRGVGRSWQRIADEIEELTGTVVARFTLTQWYPEYRDKP